jgi:uncharacterized repeat protein (TIGR03803 family)
MAPFTPLVADASGNLYGAAEQGGQYGQGEVYELSPPTSKVKTWTHTAIYSFPPSKSLEGPQGALVKGPNGVLYGTAASANGCTVFQLSPPAAGSTEWTESDDYRFSNQKNASCAGSLIGGPGGALFGIVPDNGTSKGAVFKLTPPASGSTAWTMTTIYTLGGCKQSPTGSIGSLLLGSGGVVYGTTDSCGKFGWGVVFKLTPPSSGRIAWTDSDIYNFTEQTVDFRPLSIGANGVIYGPNGSAIAALTAPANGQTVWTLNTFQIQDGTLSQASALIPGAGGSFYGATSSGGTYGFGFVFKLSPPKAGQTQWLETVLYKFNGADGSVVLESLVKGTNGQLYGVADAGGASGNGTVFSLGPPSASQADWVETTLYNFSGVASVSPNATLIGDGTGALYGMSVLGDTSEGFSAGNAIFKVTPPAHGQSAWSYEQIYSKFNYSDLVGTPQAPLIKGKNGELFGAFPDGTGDVFILTPPSAVSTAWTKTDISPNYASYNIPDAPQVASLVQGPDGTLYGTTGAAGQAAAVFAISPPTQDLPYWNGGVIYQFSEVSIYNQYFVTIGSDGTLYGVASEESGTGSSNNFGYFFKLTPPDNTNLRQYWTQTILYSFQGGADGSTPNGPLLAGPGGVLYGTTLYGGDATGAQNPLAGDGTVFALRPPPAGQTAWTENVLYRFGGGRDGSFPESTLLRGKDGTLYGITSFGGEDVVEDASAGNGTVYKLTPPKSAAGTWTHSVLHRFVGGRDGSVPLSGLMLNSDGKLYGTTVAGGGSGQTGLYYPFNIPTHVGETPTFSGTGTVFQITP